MRYFDMESPYYCIINQQNNPKSWFELHLFSEDEFYLAARHIGIGQHLILIFTSSDFDKESGAVFIGHNISCWLETKDYTGLLLNNF